MPGASDLVVTTRKRFGRTELAFKASFVPNHQVDLVRRLGEEPVSGDACEAPISPILAAMLEDQADPAESGAEKTVGYSRTERGRKPPLENLGPRTRFSLWYYLILFFGFFLLQSLLFSGTDAREISYSEFRQDVRAGKVERLIITQDRIHGRLRSADEAGNKHRGSSAPIEVPAKRAPWHLGQIWAALKGVPEDLRSRQEAAKAEQSLHFTVVPLEDPGLLDLLEQHNVEYRGRIESRWLQHFFLNWVVPFALLLVLWGFLMRRMGKGPGMLNVGKSEAKIYEVDPESRVRFSDLAGVDEAIEETREIVSFLHDPKKYRKLGAKLPKGALLVGPPGTGKTLLARAIAGESQVPFFSLSGSDFVEMFVGVGAARVRDLFESAKKKAPCIIFIDELDAVGKARAQNVGFVTGGYDERENTLNQMLVEMDGFDTSSGVVLLAATNRPEILDPALLRPGRFDRRIVLDRPGRAGRTAIFRIHARELQMSPDVDFDSLAAQTPGMVGADIANVCNEAALLASRREHDRVEAVDFQEAIERTIAGPEKKSRVVSPSERERIAYHESGHALIGYLTLGSDPIRKISIIPRGEGALGYTLQLPLEDRYLMSRGELLDRVRVLLGGRASEEVVFGEVSTGASDDLEKASEIVRQMLTAYGMSESAPNLSLVSHQNARYLGQAYQQVPHSEELERALDNEIIGILGSCFAEAKAALEGARTLLDGLAKHLLDHEQLDQAQVEKLLGPKPPTAPWSRGSSGGAEDRGGAACAPD
jgi:cell division protease FtsH